MAGFTGVINGFLTIRGGCRRKNVSELFTNFDLRMTGMLMRFFYVNRLCSMHYTFAMAFDVSIGISIAVKLLEGNGIQLWAGIFRLNA